MQIEIAQILHDDRRLKNLVRILKTKIRLRKINELYDSVKDHLTEEGRKRLEFEFKNEAKREKLFTEIHILYKFASIEFTINKPEKGDVLAQDDSIIFKIEVYQPDISRSKYLREIERKAKVTFYESVLGRETIARSYTIALNSKQLKRDRC